MRLEEMYNDTIGLRTPEPVPVKISYERCSVHGFFLVNVPRDAGENVGELFKCPLKSCQH